MTVKKELESKLQERELLLLEIQEDLTQLKVKPLSDSTATGNQPQVSRIFRTCHEMWLAHPSLSSGMYWIDPDGQQGDNAIYVYCNMTTGKMVFIVVFIFLCITA